MNEKIYVVYGACTTNYGELEEDWKIISEVKHGAKSKYCV